MTLINQGFARALPRLATTGDTRAAHTVASLTFSRMQLGTRNSAEFSTSSRGASQHGNRNAPRSPASHDTVDRAGQRETARRRRDANEQADEAKKNIERREYQKRYNNAARKWVSAIIAIPILIVTSYYLFDRLALGHGPKTLPRAKTTSGST